MYQINKELSEILFTELENAGLALYPTSIIKGDEDEIRICVYPFTPHYLEFTIEHDNSITFLYELDEVEVEYKDNLSFEDCIELIARYKYLIK